MLNRLTRWAGRTLEIVIVVCLSIMGILVFGNVVLRYAFNSGIAVSEELARLLFVWLIFLGAILGSAQHAHIGFDTLVKSLPPVWKKILVVAIGVLMLIACVIFIDGGWQQTVINLDNIYPVLGISYAWLYAVAIVFGVGMIFTVTYNIWTALRAGSGDEETLTRDLGARIEEKMDQVSTGKREDSE